MRLETTAAQDPPDPQLMRLDNMLIAEGVVGPDTGNTVTPPTNSDTAIQHADYKEKLKQIKSVYHQELEKYDQVNIELILVFDADHGQATNGFGQKI